MFVRCLLACDVTITSALTHVPESWSVFCSELCDAWPFGLEGSLSDPLVPLERLAKLFDPELVFVRVLPLYEGHTVGRLLDDQPLVSFHLESHLTVKCDPCPSACLLGQNDADLGALRKDQRSESERVRANCGEAHDIACRMGDRTATGEVVRCASSRGGDQQSVTLHDGEERIVDVDVETTHELSVTSSN